MSNNPFDRNKVREPKLGKLITESGPEVRRDAVHIAVLPVIAAEELGQGDPVALTTDNPPRAFRRSTWNSDKQEHDHSGAIGIVDPFLADRVEQGDRFWLFLFPGQVTTLSHVWTHPGILDEGAEPAKRSGKQESEAWLRMYALRFYQYSDPESGYRKLLDQLKTGTITYEGTDMHSRGELVDAEELKLHAEIVLGRTINYDDFEYFSCTC
jgi:hypothetical protein